MWNIEKVNKLSEAEKVVFDRLKKKWVIEKYEQKGYKLPWKEVWWFKSKKTHNINFYTNKNWDLLFFVFWVIRDFWYWENKKEKFETWKKEISNILEKMWYKWEKDQNWHYHMLEIKTWKEIPQESLQYYEIFKTLAFVDDKDTIVNSLNPRKYFSVFMKHWKWVYKEIADILEDINKEWKLYFSGINTGALSPLEYFSYLNLWLVEKQDILRYTKEIFNLEYFEKYYENKWFKLLEDKEFEILLWEWKANFDGERILFEKYKTYKISLKPSIKNINIILEKVLPFVEKLELKNTKNKQEKEKIKQRYEELGEYLNKKKKELESIEATKQEVSSLKEEVEK